MPSTRHSLLPAQSSMRVRHYTNKRDLDVHVAHIQRLVAEGLRDGDSRRLAVKIVSGRFETLTYSGKPLQVVTAWGKKFHAPPGKVCKAQDAECEVEKIWDFMVLNVRYVYDTVGVDVFASLKETLIMGGGDCDDATIAFGVLLGSLGFRVIARVISTSDAPNEWVHIYPIVALPKDAAPKRWIPLDITVEGATPGWQYPDIAKYVDYQLTPE